MWKSFTAVVVCVAAVVAWWSLPGSLRVHSAGLDTHVRVLVPAGDDNDAGH